MTIIVDRGYISDLIPLMAMEEAYAFVIVIR